MKPAVIIVDMLKDNADIGASFSIGEEGRKIIPNLQHLLATVREKNIPVIFACDSFLEGDFIFQSGMKPHCIRGTPGAEVISELQPQDSDIILPKRRFSAFFKTDLDMTLRLLGVDTIVVGGISTPGCVMFTAFDGISNDFEAIILEDCCAARKAEIHEKALSLYKGMLLIEVMSLTEFISRLESVKKE